MKNIILITSIIFTVGLSCKKSTFNDPVPAAAFNVINAAPDVPSLNVNLTSNPLPYYLYLQPIYYGSAFEWTLAPGDSPVVIVSSLDTSGNIYSGNINFTARKIYSLYVLNGSGKDNTLLMADSIPAYTDDSVAGIRFINLSPDNRSLTVNIAGNDPSQKEFGPLAYKQISAFKSYDASNIGGAYYFEIRDPALPDPIAIFSWYYLLGKNYTVVISGSEDPASSFPINVFQVNNY